MCSPYFRINGDPKTTAFPMFPKFINSKVQGRYSNRRPGLSRLHFHVVNIR